MVMKDGWVEWFFGEGFLEGFLVRFFAEGFLLSLKLTKAKINIK